MYTTPWIIFTPLHTTINNYSKSSPIFCLLDLFCFDNSLNPIYVFICLKLFSKSWSPCEGLHPYRKLKTSNITSWSGGLWAPGFLLHTGMLASLPCVSLLWTTTVLKNSLLQCSCQIHNTPVFHGLHWPLDLMSFIYNLTLHMFYVQLWPIISFSNK